MHVSHFIFRCVNVLINYYLYGLYEKYIRWVQKQALYVSHSGSDTILCAYSHYAYSMVSSTLCEAYSVSACNNEIFSNWASISRSVSKKINYSFMDSLGTSQHIIRTLHACPSQMNGNLILSNTKLTSDSLASKFRSFARDKHAGCIL